MFLVIFLFTIKQSNNIGYLHRVLWCFVPATDKLLMGFILFQTGTNTEIASFWVRVSLRFQANDRSDAKWKRWFRYVHGVSWLTFLSLAIALIFYDQPLLILIYNLQVIVYTVFSWVLLFVAYRTIYQNTISRLSTSSSTRSLSSSKSKNAKTRERNLKSVQKLTGVALGSIAALTCCLLALFVATALDVTKTPLGYLINVGFVYRFAEILYIGTLCYIMKVKQSKSKRKSSGRGGGGREGTKKKLQSKDRNSGGGGTKKKAATANIGHSSLSATPSTSAPTTLSPQVPSFSSDLSRDSNSYQWLGAFANGRCYCCCCCCCCCCYCCCCCCCTCILLIGTVITCCIEMYTYMFYFWHGNLLLAFIFLLLAWQWHSFF